MIIRLIRRWRIRRTYHTLCAAYQRKADNRADWARWGRKH